MSVSEQDFKLSFTWYKPSIGYKWEDCQICDPWGEIPTRSRLVQIYGDIPDGPHLTELDYGQSFISWKPFDNPALFAQFADLIPRPEEILQWANQHGRLIDVESKNGAFILSKHLDAKKRVKNDPWLFWHNEQRELGFVTMLWEMLNNNDHRLNEIIMWSHEGQRLHICKIKKELLDEIDFKKIRTDKAYLLKYATSHDLLFDKKQGDTWMIRHCRFPDVINAALAYIQISISNKLSEYPMQTKFRIDEDGLLHKTLVPTSLLSAMWYQFHLAVIGKIKLRRCSICGKWENMEGHRANWSKHANCANYQRVKRSRNLRNSKLP